MKNTPLSSTRTYLFSYEHEGASWVIEVQAANVEDAKERVRKMATASLDGVLAVKIPASLGVLARLIVVMRNALSRKPVESNVFKA